MFIVLARWLRASSSYEERTPAVFSLQVATLHFMSSIIPKGNLVIYLVPGIPVHGYVLHTRYRAEYSDRTINK